MPKIKKQIGREMYSALVSNMLAAEYSQRVDDILGNVCWVKFRSKESMCSVVSFDESIYLFEINIEKGEADLQYICEEEFFTFRKKEFANNLRKNEELSKAGFDLIFGNIKEDEYIMQLALELAQSRRLNTQSEIARKEILIFKLMNMVDIENERSKRLSEINKRVLEILAEEEVA